MGLAAQIKGLAGGSLPAALGHRVRRPGVATDLAAVATVNIFTVSGGDILLTHIYGIVTVGPIGAGLTTLDLQHTPTGGVATAMCAASAAINTDAVNTIYTITGAVAGAMVASAGLGVGVASMVTNMQVLVPGIILLNVAVAVNTGTIDWILHYVPLDTDSRVTIL